jgi:AhpD family alkylhydroperoxidase
MAASSAVADQGDGCIGFHVNIPVRMGASCQQLTETLAVVDRNPSNEERRRFRNGAVSVSHRGLIG